MFSAENLALTSPVLRTYEVGLRFEGLSCTTRRKNQRRAIQIIETLQQELRERLTPERVDQALTYIRTNPKVSGTTGAAHLAKLMQDRSNLGQAAWLLLLNAVKGVLDREKKLQLFLDLLVDNPTATVEWFVLGRTPYLEKQLMHRLHVHFDYCRNLILAARRTLDSVLPEELQLTSPLPELSEAVWLRAIETYYQQTRETLSPPADLTENQQKFLRKLKQVYQNRAKLAKQYVTWVQLWNQPKGTRPRSRWHWLKQLSKTYHEGTLKATPGRLQANSYVYLSLLRGILVSALLPPFKMGKTVNKLRETQHLRVEHLVPKPFQKKKKKNAPLLPLALVMSSKYVVGRPGNNKVLTSLARTHGQFQIAIWPPRQRKAQLMATVQLHPKAREFLTRGAKIKLLILESTPAPSEKLRASLVLEGQYWMFLSRTAIERATVHFCPTQTPRHALGVDINRPGIHMLAFSEPILLSPHLEKLCTKYLQLGVVLAQLGKAVTRATQWAAQFPSIFSYRRQCKMQGELQRVYKRRQRLLKELKRETTRFLTSVLIQTGCRIFCVEDLSLSSRGTRGALAKAILAMPDEEMIYLRSVLQAMYITGSPIELRVVTPYKTSQGEHMTCSVDPPGKLNRTSGSWDLVKCFQCQQIVDMHRNAAIKIRQVGLEQEVPFPSTSSPTAVRIPAVTS